jgi:hypothetical protein
MVRADILAELEETREPEVSSQFVPGLKVRICADW